MGMKHVSGLSLVFRRTGARQIFLRIILRGFNFLAQERVVRIVSSYTCRIWLWTAAGRSWYTTVWKP